MKRHSNLKGGPRHAVISSMGDAPGRARLIATVAAGMLAVSFGAVLVRKAQEAPSLTIAFYRMFWACLLLAPFYWQARQTQRAGAETPRTARSRTLAAWLFLGGLALALHFAFWIASLRHTSVAVSVFLVNTSPIMVAAASFFLFGERLTRRGFAGIVLAFVGAGLLFRHDLSRLGDWSGAGLALAGAAALALYLIAGRKARERLDLWEYVFPAYTLAAALLALMCLGAGEPFAGFSSATWAFLLLLGVIPQGIGHTCYNWSLKHLPATVVSTLVLAEPILAPSLAWIFLGERLGATEVLGGALVAAGILLVSMGGVRSKSFGQDQQD